MADLTQDLWPEDIGAPLGGKLPVALLREQAIFLGTRTKNLVEADVLSESEWETNLVPAPALVHRFILRAPTLSNYRYELLSVHQPAILYPLKILFGNEIYDAASDTELAEHLRRIFSADATRRIVSALVAQSAA